MTESVESPRRPHSAPSFRPLASAILLSLVISAIIVAPFLWRGNASGHDFEFHLQSWVDAAGQWKQGILYPRWTEWGNFGFGEPRFIFYPPGSWMLGALLGLLLPWNAVPGVFIVLAQTLSGVSAFILARRIMPGKAALFGAACYAANPYALLIIYLRSDYAELLANVFFPLVILAALSLCEWLPKGIPQDWSRLQRAILFFGAAFAAIWLCNAPAGVIAAYTSGLLFLCAAISGKTMKPLVRGAGGLALGFGLAAFYLVPAAYEQKWVNIAQALATGLLPSENFLYTAIDDPEHTVFNWIASTIAVFMIVAAGLAALQARGKKEAREHSLAPAVWSGFLLIAGVSTALMLRFSWPIWAVLPKLRYVQFPWRWMSMLAVAFAIFAGAALARSRRSRLGALAISVCIAVIGAGLAKRAWWDRSDIPTLRKAVASGRGYDGTDEYDPAGDDHTNILSIPPDATVMDTDTMQAPDVKPVVRVDRWSPEDKEISVRSQLPFFLGLRLLNYPAWQVKVNGAVVTPQGGEDFNQMIVEMPAGDSRVQVHFKRTWDRTAGGVLSILSLLAGVWLFVGKRFDTQGRATLPPGFFTSVHSKGS